VFNVSNLQALRFGLLAERFAIPRGLWTLYGIYSGYSSSDGSLRRFPSFSGLHGVSPLWEYPSVFRLSARDIDAFTVRGGTVYAVKADGEYALRERLYRLEERFPDFIRINQSTLVRRGAIKRFDTSFGGALRVTLSSGFSDYISRRQITAVKKGLGLK